MCKQLSRTFRPEHRDVEVVYRDAFEVEKRLYVGLVSPAGPVDVDTVVQKHFAQEDKLAENVRRALNPPPRPPETALPGAAAGEESAKPPEAKPEPIAAPKRPRTRRKGK